MNAELWDIRADKLYLRHDIRKGFIKNTHEYKEKNFFPVYFTRKELDMLNSSSEDHSYSKGINFLLEKMRDFSY